MNTITTNRVNEYLAQGFEVFTVWYFNNFTDTGSIGHREYQTMVKKDGKIFQAQE